ncbi:MAG: hypothetical protein A2068_08050 [Ignavibacteria bacterium GWB2_35_6b]|nr:MAG: hypothetical protein A2068_08050 [Ignavibacteria bacterium GWB2_35_6b]
MGRRGRLNLTGECFFFVTTTVVKFTPVFSYAPFCDILIDNIKHYRKRYKFDTLGYVIMPSHFHWIVKTEPEFGSISDIMRDIKKFSAWKIFDLIELEKLNKLENIFIKEAEGIEDQKRKLWMKRFDDEVIRNEKMFWTKLKYIHNNPVKSGLVLKPEDYKYSSPRNFVYGDHSVLEVDTDYAGIEII